MKKTTITLLITAFLINQYVSGMYRTCIYRAPGGNVAISVAAVDLCPLSIEVD